LSRCEFERRFDATPNLKKAELIDGVVYVQGPVSFVDHAGPHFDLIGWFGNYAVATPGIEGGSSSSIRLDERNEPQPDGCLLIQPQYGGRVQVDAEGYIVGGPELVGEIAASSVSYDLHDKLRAYLRNQVQEYVVWRVWDKSIDWFILRDGNFERQPLNAQGYYQSMVFPGLWLDPNALITGDMVKVMQVLQQGLATPEHADFVERLCQAGAQTPGQPT